ncbi:MULTISPECIES: hypothetical protein [unclassified Burkholderia]|uniref:hypothetical protein n=1 Tax=unclassified Burkholderia TaxID=2613784 RepID=UPI002AB1BD72|nr:MULTISPECIES: hypothetical protein [unclassified Burkholderia]
MSHIWKALGALLVTAMWLAPVPFAIFWLLPWRQVAEIAAIVVVQIIVACRLPEPLLHPGFLIVPLFGVMFTYEVQTMQLHDWLFQSAFAWGLSALGCEFLRNRLGQVRELDEFKRHSN